MLTILIRCTCNFQSGSLFFVYFGFLCKCIQCLISTLTQGGEGGHLFRLTCSIVLRRGRNTASNYHWCVWGVLAGSGPHPAHGVCVFPVYSAQAPGCSAGELSKAGPGFHALPGSKQLRFRFSGTPQRHRLGWAHVLCHSQVQAVQVTRCLASTLSQVGCASYYLPSPSRSVSRVRSESAYSSVLCVSSGELISGWDNPGRCQPSRIPGKLG